MILMSLFSVFDPASYFGYSMNWVIILMIFIMFPVSYYMMNSMILGSTLNIKMLVNNTFKEVSYPNYSGLSYMGLAAFLYLVFSNLMGLFPFVFTSTAHLVITMGMGMVFWLSFFIMGFLKNFKHSVAHLVPEGSPMVLSPLLVMIESISHLMRPFTLSIRLAANMMAGHLIVGLLASISMLNFFGLFSSVILQSILLMLEFGVGVIQGFVFSILILLYAMEYY